MRNIKISVCRLSVRPDAVKFYETVFFICLSVFLIKAGYVLVKKSGEPVFSALTLHYLCNKIY